MIGFPRQLADRPVLRRRDDLCIPSILIRVQRGVLTGGVRNLRPQVLGTRVAAIAHVKSNALAARGIHGNPHPLRVGFFLHNAGQGIGFHVKPLDQHIAGTGDGVDMEMIGQGLEALDQKTHEPLEGDAHRATDTAQRHPLHQQAFDKTSLVIGDEVLLVALDKLAPTVVAVMIVFAIVNVAVFLRFPRI